ncbi:SNF2 family N-terminal domain-containing protein [Xylaria sp. FL0064]|nr:SNF2 family N-terminal domain-containing protein [Xylaria sp. FL0064]
MNVFGSAEAPGSRDIQRDITSSRASTSEDICFGMLKDNNAQFATLQLLFSEDRCDVFAHGVPIATMGTKIYLALKSLSSGELFSYRGVVPKSEFHQKLALVARTSQGHSSRTCCNIALIIIGPRSLKDTLARELSRYRLFLQHPIPMPNDLIYENPQYLSMVTSSFGNGVILPPIALNILDQGSRKQGAIDPESATIEAVLDSLPRHQKDAVNFMANRESTEKPTNTLWKAEGVTAEAPLYKHIITGSSSPKPIDILGGVLGDGMGLGKTLSMIACIISSLSAAEIFKNDSIEASSQGITSRAAVSSTLVIVPSVLLLDAWIDEIKRHVVPGTLSFYKYHGPNRNLPSSPPLPYHIVLSTYDTVTADYSRGKAHEIRNSATKRFKALNNLSASIRWCITGTPVQDSLKDLSSLITFLRVPLLGDPAKFRKYIEGRPETVSGNSKPNYRNLRYLLESICLRRCTSSILSSLGVSFIKHRPCLSEHERKGYNELSMLCDRYIKAEVSGESANGGNNSILVVIMRLRMFCDTGHLDSKDKLFNDTEGGLLRPDEVISLLQQCGEAVCTSCKKEVLFSDAATLPGKGRDPASHRLKCRDCVQRSSDMRYSTNLQVELKVLKSLVGVETLRGEQTEHDNRTSYPSKIKCLVEDIQKNSSEEKSIVFSFWRRSLDLIEKLLNEQGIHFGRADGTVHPSKRQEMLTDFRDNPSVRVLLMTIGTGAVG